VSLTATLSTALSGLATAQRALGVTSHNVANANTEGYTRKVARQESVAVDGRGAGARSLDPERVVDEFLEGELRQQRSRLGRSEALVRYHDRVQETLFGAPGDGNRGVANRVSRLATAAEALANAPEKAALRVAFVGAAQDLVRQVADDAGRVQLLRGDVDREIALTVDEINAEVRELDRLNGEVARTRAPAELLDRRDAILSSLAEKLPISVVRQEDGRIAVYTRGGQALLEYAPNRLDYQPAAQVGAATSFGPIRLFRADDTDPATGLPREGAASAVVVTGGVRAALTPELAADAVPDADQRVSSPLASGRLQGLLEARDRLLPELGDQLGELAGMVRFTLNAAHNDAVPHPPPDVLTGTRTDLAGWNGGANGGAAHLAVVDRATGATVTSFAVDAAAASPADVAAQINAGLAGLGSAFLNARGALEIRLDDPARGLALDEGDSRVAVTDAAGHARDHGLAHYFGLNDLIVATGPGPTDLAVRPDILADGGRLSAVALSVEPGPPPVARAGGGGDSRPAQALAAALQRGVDTVARGALAARRATVGEYAADLVALGAVAADQAGNAEATDRAVVDDLAFRRGSVSGVNLDEELSRLVLYQQAYSVSARIVSVTNQLFDDLLAIGR
jgi:flagellar hook-associated protein 1